MEKEELIKQIKQRIDEFYDGIEQDDENYDKAPEIIEHINTIIQQEKI